MAEPLVTPLDRAQVAELRLRSPMSVAEWYAAQNMGDSGKIVVRSPLLKHGYTTAHNMTFFFAKGKVSVYRSLPRQRLVNGACAHCGALFLHPVLRLVIGKHPESHRVISPAIGTEGISTVVAEYGTAWACDACIKANGWTIVGDAYAFELAPWRGYIEKNVWANPEPLPQRYDFRSLYAVSVTIDLVDNHVAVEGREVHGD